MSARRPAKAKAPSVRTSQLQTSVVRPGLRLIYSGKNPSEPRRVLTLSWLVMITAPADDSALRDSITSMVERSARERIEGARHTITLSNGLEWEIGGSGS